ncbi:hypothetical protein [Streptobacillus moniliformis]|uniref:hypothetical protein n=1 Tax=Streptobacillus moniliformis TaxID=34105 RepID=UPI0007E482CF|nr:hypothetical protein [Streptobacillus moniliformis]
MRKTRKEREETYASYHTFLKKVEKVETSLKSLKHIKGLNQIQYWKIEILTEKLKLCKSYKQNCQNAIVLCRNNLLGMDKIIKSLQKDKDIFFLSYEQMYRRYKEVLNNLGHIRDNLINSIDFLQEMIDIKKKIKTEKGK